MTEGAAGIEDDGLCGGCARVAYPEVPMYKARSDVFCPPQIYVEVVKDDAPLLQKADVPFLEGRREPAKWPSVKRE